MSDARSTFQRVGPGHYLVRGSRLVIRNRGGYGKVWTIEDNHTGDLVACRSTFQDAKTKTLELMREESRDARG